MSSRLRKKEGREGRRFRERKLNSLSSLIPLLHQTSNDPETGILPVESMSELLSSGLVLELEGKRLKHDSVPFGLEGVEEGRDGGGSGWTGSGDVGSW